MKRSLIALLLASGRALSSAAMAQGVAMDFGLDEYRGNCMVCHGERGKGDGSYGELLKTSLPDLTTLAKRNGGVFPFDRVVQTIDGRAMPRAHGTSDMPIWGQAYTQKARQYFPGQTGMYDPYVRARVLALTDYIFTLQQR